MNIFLIEYFGFCFELNFELNHFKARFNEKMNFQKKIAHPQPIFHGNVLSQLLDYLHIPTQLLQESVSWLIQKEEVGLEKLTVN